jgi:hypothetical protein
MFNNKHILSICMLTYTLCVIILYKVLFVNSVYNKVKEVSRNSAYSSLYEPPFTGKSNEQLFQSDN